MSETDLPRTRVWFVDALRLLAAFQMLQGHTLSALLAPGSRHGAWYVAWSNLRGLTSVAFLFTSGMALYFATVRSFDAHRRSARAVSRRVVRALRLIGLGYLLHLPLPALLAGRAAAPGELRELLAVDVLQCIGVSLLLLEASVLCAPSVRVWLCLVAGGAVVLSLGTPWAYRAAFLLPPPLAAYLGPGPGSQFPLWPWAAHMFAGVLSAAWVASTRTRASVRMALLGAVLLATGQLLAAAGALPALVDHVCRLGWVAGIAAGLAGVTRSVQRPPAWLAGLAAESLFLYVFHVLLVYGRPFGLAAWLGPSLNLPTALGAALAVVGSSCVAALVYRRARAR